MVLDPGGWRRVVLVGFMGAGKTTVGRSLAKRLGWRFVDLDAAVEAADGRRIPAIFAEEGEPFFRALEARISAEVLAGDGVVVATGGGWAATPGWADRLPEQTATVWLQVSPEEAVRRASTEPGQRPLLEVDHPLNEARALLDRRRAAYAAAHWRVDTERSSVEDVTARILESLSAHPPRP
jgi:shikimate kinase